VPRKDPRRRPPGHRRGHIQDRESARKAWVKCGNAPMGAAEDTAFPDYSFDERKTALLALLDENGTVVGVLFARYHYVSETVLLEHLVERLLQRNAGALVIDRLVPRYTSL